MKNFQRCFSARTMAAVRVHVHGGPEALSLERVPLLTAADCAPHECVVEVRRAGLNFIDTYFRTGLYGDAADLPIGLGKEAAGVVVAAGASSAVACGDRVACLVPNGAYADRVLVPGASCHTLPHDVSFDSATAALIQGMTAHYLACDTPIPSGGERTSALEGAGSDGLVPGCTVLVHAAAGGTGQLLVQVAKLRGARVLATVGAEWKAEAAHAAGADEVLVCARSEGSGAEEATDFAAWCRELTGGVGVDVVYDGVGLSTYERSMRSLRRRGMLVLFGNASGAVPPLDPLSLSAHGSLYVTRPTLFQYIDGPGEERQRMGDVLCWIKSGELRVAMHDTIFSFEEAAAAHQALESGGTTGKILLAPSKFV